MAHKNSAICADDPLAPARLASIGIGRFQMARIVPSIAVAICMLCPATVRADSVTITSGSVTTQEGRGFPGLVGTFNGDMFSMAFLWNGLVILPPCRSGCQAGDAISLSSFARAETMHTEGIDNDATGSAIIDGTLYTGLAFVGDLAFVGPTFTLPPVPPLDPPFAVLLSSPFVLTGTISGYDVRSSRDPVLRFTTDVVGTGTVSAVFGTGPGQQYHLGVFHGSPQYDFAPVPEPGTLLLVGGGLAAAWVRGHRGRPNRLRH